LAREEYNTTGEKPKLQNFLDGMRRACEQEGISLQQLPVLDQLATEIDGDPLESPEKWIFTPLTTLVRWLNVELPVAEEKKVKRYVKEMQLEDFVLKPTRNREPEEDSNWRRVPEISATEKAQLIEGSLTLYMVFGTLSNGTLWKTILTNKKCQHVRRLIPSTWIARSKSKTVQRIREQAKYVMETVYGEALDPRKNFIVDVVKWRGFGEYGLVYRRLANHKGNNKRKRRC
jgi:hypothetical protein